MLNEKLLWCKYSEIVYSVQPYDCGIIVIVSFVFFFKQKTAYEMRISDWSSDVCSSDLRPMLERSQFGIGLVDIGGENRRYSHNDHPALRDWNGFPDSSAGDHGKNLSPSSGDGGPAVPRSARH